MTGTVHSITRDTDASRLAAVADHIRTTDEARCTAAADLADLLEAVATAVNNRSDPPMTEAEMWRWSAVVGRARAITRRWLQ